MNDPQRLLVTAALCLGCVAISGRAHAQGSGAEKTAAEALFGEGKRLMDQGKFGEACPKFADSQKLDPGVGTLLNLARCYQKNGQTATAWSTYKEAAAAARNAGQAERESVARREASALEPTLPKLTIAVSSDAAALPNIEVRLDGASLPRGLWGVAAPVDPGEHLIEARASNKKSFSRKTQVVAKSSVTVTIPALSDGSGSDVAAVSEAHESAPAGESTSPAPTTHGKSSQGVIGLVVAGAGVVAIAAGSAMALSAKSSYDGVPADQCDPSGCNDVGFDTRQNARDKAGVATIVFGIGAAAVVGGGVIWLTAPSSSKTGSASLGIGPSGMSLRGSF